MSTTTGKAITIHFDGSKCVHARRCVLGAPAVFKPGTKGGWIFPDEGNAEVLARIIDSCPSGALTYERSDGGEGEAMAPVNTARLWENGPNEMRGDLHIAGEEPRERALLCRCGQSANKPFCDNSHIKAGFEATSEPHPNIKSGPLKERGGPLKIEPAKDGPVMCNGNLEIIAGSGRRIACQTNAALCRCGASQNKPFCDGSHVKTGFKADGV